MNTIQTDSGVTPKGVTFRARILNALLGPLQLKFDVPRAKWRILGDLLLFLSLVTSAMIGAFALVSVWLLVLLVVLSIFFLADYFLVFWVEIRAGRVHFVWRA